MSRLRKLGVAVIVVVLIVVQVAAVRDVGEGAQTHASLLLFAVP